MRIATAMKGLHYVLHAPQGDTYADLLFTMIERRDARPPVTYTTFQARDLGGQRVDAALLEVDLAVTGSELSGVGGDRGELLRRHLQCGCAQGMRVGDRGNLLGRHGLIVSHQNVCSGITEVDNRIQSTPAHNHSNCSRDSVHVASPERGQWKRPACSRRTHSHTPVASISSSLIREPARLRNT
jgi:hypothetical protein